jgi:pantothenate kinase type III
LKNWSARRAAAQRRINDACSKLPFTHLGLPYDEQTHQRIASRLFGGTATFHRGTTQQWRERYNEAHLQLAREHLSDLLTQLGYEPTA